MVGQQLQELVYHSDRVGPALVVVISLDEEDTVVVEPSGPVIV
jgi:hypothetical protein